MQNEQRQQQKCGMETNEMEWNGIATDGRDGGTWQESVCTQMWWARYDKYSVIFRVQSHLQSFLFVSHISFIKNIHILSRIFFSFHELRCAATSSFVRVGFSQTLWGIHCQYTYMCAHSMLFMHDFACAQRRVDIDNEWKKHGEWQSEMELECAWWYWEFQMFRQHHQQQYSRLCAYVTFVPIGGAEAGAAEKKTNDIPYLPTPFICGAINNIELR